MIYGYLLFELIHRSHVVFKYFHIVVLTGCLSRLRYKLTVGLLSPSLTQKTHTNKNMKNCAKHMHAQNVGKGRGQNSITRKKINTSIQLRITSIKNQNRLQLSNQVTDFEVDCLGYTSM